MNPKDLKYSETHEWVKIDGDTAIVGITDHAQNELKDIVYVELPEIGKKVSKNDTVLVIESVKNVSEVHTPLSGEIIEINDKLTTNPVAINQDPYGEGWIFKLKLLDPEEGNKLIDFAAYNDIVKS